MGNANDKPAAPNPESKFSIIVDRIKKPLLFVIVCAFAAYALKFVQSKKADFDKLQKAPLVVADDNDPNFFADRKDSSQTEARIRGVRPISAAKLAEQINKSLEPKNKKQQEIVSAAVDNVKHQNFQNTDELIRALNEMVLAHRDYELKKEYAKLERFQKAQAEIEEKKIKALAELKFRAELLDKEKSGDGSQTVKVSELLEAIKPSVAKTTQEGSTENSTAYLYKALGEYEKTEATLSDLESFIRQSAENDRDLRTFADSSINVKNTIESAGQIYQPIFKSIYTTLNSGKTMATLLPPASPGDLDLLLDDKNGLGVVHKLISVTLTAVIVFALLYLILIPLKHIFFLTTSADTVAAEAKKLLERKESANAASAAPLVRALVVTTAVVGIGAAAITANPFAGAPAVAAGHDSQTEIETPKTSVPRRDLPQTKPTPIDFEFNPGVSQLTIDRLAQNIGVLETSVNDLQAAIKEMPTPTPVQVNVDSEEFARALDRLTVAIKPFADQMPDMVDEIKKINATLGPAQQRAGSQAEPRTIIDTLNDFAEVMGDPKAPTKGTMLGNSRIMLDLIGTKSDRDSLLGNLFELNRTIGTIHDPTNRNTLVGNLLSVSNNTDSIKNTTGEIRTNDLTRSRGRNIFTQAQNLFSRERYVVTQTAVEELEKIIDDNDLKKALRELAKISDSKEPMSASKLYKELNKQLKEKEPKLKLDKKSWEKWRRLIFLYTRVAYR